MVDHVFGDTSVPRAPQRPSNRVLGIITACCALIVLITTLGGIGPASSETPAERCARETSAYNAAWAASWATANPGQSPANAPAPPVPYVCAEPQDPTTTSPTPATTAPGLPEAADTGTGPQVGAHAPTDLPAAGATAIVQVPTAATPRDSSRPAAPSTSGPDPRTSASRPGSPNTSRPPSSTSPSTSTTPPSVVKLDRTEQASAVDQSLSAGSTSNLIPTSIWALVGAAALTAGALSTRRRFSTLRNGRGVNRGLSPTLVSNYGTNANDAAGDGPVHLYPNDPIGLGADGPSPNSSMEWVPDYPGATTGTIEWQNTPPVAPDSQYVEYNIEVVRNGVPEPAVYTLNGKTFQGSIRANAGDVISIRQNGIAQGSRLRTIVDITGDMMPIRVPVAGQTDGGPGRWVPANEAMPDTSAYYQEAVTHVQARNWVYKVGDTGYDGFYTDITGQQWLLEAKGDYSGILDKDNPNVFGSWNQQTAKSQGQTFAQVNTANQTNARVAWYLQQSATVNAFQNAARLAGVVDQITWNIAPQGRPNVY